MNVQTGSFYVAGSMLFKARQTKRLVSGIKGCLLFKGGYSIEETQIVESNVCLYYAVYQITYLQSSGEK